MGGKTSKAHHQETPGGSQETNQKETKGDTGQELAKEFASKLSLGPSKKEGRRHVPTQQGYKCEEKAGASEKSLPGSREVNGEADPTRNGPSADTLLHNDEVNTAVVVLTLITDICKQAPNPSIEEQEQLRAVFEQMPYLLTLEARGRYGDELVLAIQFLTTVYDHSESVNWGAIESFDDLQLTLESLKRFGSRTEARPREGPYGEFIV
ncbi:hypothetical protein FG05_09620 [Fusarium graminearum]|nr:hypothetical protein FG05_09620 [Fusarium graminearum]